MRNVAIAVAAYLFWPSLAILLAIAWRACWDHFVTRPQVERRLAEDREVALLEELWDLPSRSGRVL